MRASVGSRAQRATRGPSRGVASALCALLAVLTTAAGAEDAPAWWEGALTLSTGFSYATGDFGEPVDTDLIYVPATLIYRMDELALTPYPWDQLELRVTVPFLAIDGPADPFRGAPPSGSRSDSGLGDVLVRASYIWLPRVRSHWPVFELQAQVKIPTADETRNLGTGSTDFELQIGLSKAIGPLWPFVSVGYRFVGDSERLGLRSFVFTTVGGSMRVHPRLVLGLDYEFAQASAARRDASHELVPFANIRLPGRFTLAPYATFGLAGYTPDFGGGFSIGYTLPIRRGAGLIP